MKLENYVAIITGGGRGIGRETALAFAKEGADIVLAARTETEITSVAGEIEKLGRRALAIPTDVHVKSDVDKLVNRQTDMSRYGVLFIFINIKTSKKLI